MLIKTDRSWNLKITQRGKKGCVDLTEIHKPWPKEESNLENNNAIAIPLESLGEVIAFLQKVKLKGVAK